MPSTHPANRLVLQPPPLSGTTRHSPGAASGVFAIRLSDDRLNDDFPRWLVLDSKGRIVARAHSRLLAIAKMKIQVLAELTAPRQPA